MQVMRAQIQSVLFASSPNHKIDKGYEDPEVPFIFDFDSSFRRESLTQTIE